MVNSNPWLGSGILLQDENGSIQNSLIENANPLCERVFHLIWTPAASIAAHLRLGFTWHLRCVREGSGRVHVLPCSEGGWGKFVSSAFLVGLAAAEASGKYPPEMLMRHRVLWFLYRRVRHTHEWFKNTSIDSRGLLITGSAREGSERSVLDILGLPEFPIGKPWSGRRLITHGRKVAKEKGDPCRTEAMAVAYAFYDLASRTAYADTSIDTEGAARHVREALVRYPDVPPEGPIIEEVFLRFANAVSGHLDVGLQSGTLFDSWLLGGGNSIVNQLSKTKPKLDRQVVASALTMLGWKAVRQVNEYVAHAASLVGGVLQGVLADSDRESFKVFFAPQPGLGDLTFPMLADHLPFLRPVTSELRRRPAGSRILGTALQMFVWYRTWTEARREADRRVQARRGKKVADIGTIDRISNKTLVSAEEQTDAESRLERLQNSYKRIRTVAGIRCRCETPEWITCVEMNGDDITISHQCTQCMKKKKTRHTVAELKGLVDDSV